MGVIAEFTIEEDQFPLGSALAGTPDMSLELDRVAPVASRGVPYLWASGEDHEAFERAVRKSPLIETLTTVDRIGDSVLYRIEWGAETNSLLQRIVGANATILEAYREHEHWLFRLRFDEHDDLSAFNDHCSEADINYRVTRVFSDGESGSRTTAFGLSHRQRDALILAVERGYFDVPRETTLSEIGTELGISQQAASEHVRRAAGKVLRTILLASDHDLANE